MVKAALAVLPLAEAALFLREGPGGSLAGLVQAGLLVSEPNVASP